MNLLDDTVTILAPLRPDIPNNASVMSQLSFFELTTLYKAYLRQMQKALGNKDYERIVRIQTILVDLGRETTRRQTKAHSALKIHTQGTLPEFLPTSEAGTPSSDDLAADDVV